MQRQVYGEPAENWITRRDLDWRELAAITEFIFRWVFLLDLPQWEPYHDTALRSFSFTTEIIHMPRNSGHRAPKLGPKV